MKYNKLLHLLPFIFAAQGNVTKGKTDNSVEAPRDTVYRGISAGIPASAYFQRKSSYKHKKNMQKFSKAAKIRRRKQR